MPTSSSFVLRPCTPSARRSHLHPLAPPKTAQSLIEARAAPHPRATVRRRANSPSSAPDLIARGPGLVYIFLECSLTYRSLPPPGSPRRPRHGWFQRGGARGASERLPPGATATAAARAAARRVEDPDRSCLPSLPPSLLSRRAARAATGGRPGWWGGGGAAVRCTFAAAVTHAPVLLARPAARSFGRARCSFARTRSVTRAPSGRPPKDGAMVTDTDTDTGFGFTRRRNPTCVSCSGLWPPWALGPAAAAAAATAARSLGKRASRRLRKRASRGAG